MAREFAPKLLEVSGQTASVLSPVAFQGRIDELTLERWIVECPELVGERLLVLGRQLAEFEEDQGRLDVLAIDDSGELVLIELKVTENFRVTDLQALGYAGAYAARTTAELAHTLLRTLRRDAAVTAPPAAGNEQPAGPGPATEPASLDQAKATITQFLELDDFEDWEPSQHVRIKLLAPDFPRRVLKTVKWLGDVYDMPIEAIAVRLFEDTEKRYSLSFERILPLPGEEEFDLTVRRREDRKRTENTTRRRQPPILPILLQHGVLQDGQKLWIAKDRLPLHRRASFAADNPALQVRINAPNGASPRFEWRPTESDPYEALPPSDVFYRLWTDVFGLDRKPFKTGVANRFTVEPEGQTLAQIAFARGLWMPEDATDGAD
ncbi:MAG TPA: hypothetical protein VF712_20225 [Thermoleophilaceae bacterium]